MWAEVVVGDCGVGEEVVHHGAEWEQGQGLHRCRLCQEGKGAQTMLALEGADELARGKVK